MTSAPLPSPGDEQFPVADVRARQAPTEVVGLVVSRLWIATLLCALAAIGLVAAQWRSGGPEVRVHFAEGHGLQAGDPVRFRGIDVGQVLEIALGEDLDGVLVRIGLSQAASALAREGTRFWIARPDISVGQLRGLDTIVGGHHVGVVPGPPDAPPAELFYGLDLASAPIDNIADGLEIVLESSHRMGLQNGSPISYRGVTVGHILSAELASDAVTVEARAFIQPNYRELVRVNSRFWSNSGLDLKIGFSGVELDAETLATIASGGVAFATPSLPGRPAATGHRFELFESRQEEWTKWQPRIAIGNAALPAGVPVPRPLPGVRRGLGALATLSRDRQRGWVLPLANGQLLGPANVLEAATQDEYLIELAGKEFPLPLARFQGFGDLAVGSTATPLDDGIASWPVDRIRGPDAPEDIVVTCGSEELTMALSLRRLSVAEGRWEVEASVPLDDAWHGASVVAAADGLLVGMLIRSEEKSYVQPLAADLIGAAQGDAGQRDRRN
jgi:hypothetical protein